MDITHELVLDPHCFFIVFPSSPCLHVWGAETENKGSPGYVFMTYKEPFLYFDSRLEI